MTRALAALALIAGAGAGNAQTNDAPAIALARADAAAGDRIAQAIVASGFVGSYAAYQGPRRLAAGSVGAAVAGEPGGFVDDAVWPWASVTKQVVATLVMQEVDAGRMALDAPAARYLSRIGAGGPTVRQLLQHRSGLRNPDITPVGGDGMPSFYTVESQGAGGVDWCLRAKQTAGGAWAYNNCDYIVLGALVERTANMPLAELFAQRIAQPLGLTARFMDTARDSADLHWRGGPSIAERQAIAGFGAAGALVGTAVDLITLDRALVSGTLLSNPAQEQLWRGDPRLGFMALGQWSFSAPLTGCGGSVAVIERRGNIGRFMARNFILPERGITMVLFTNRGDPETGPGSMGEIWQGKGAAHDLLAAAACGA